jgi:hypothetical protein
VELLQRRNVMSKPTTRCLDIIAKHAVSALEDSKNRPCPCRHHQNAGDTLTKRHDVLQRRFLFGFIAEMTHSALCDSVKGPC